MMGLVIGLVVLAVLFGVLGLVVAALKWLLIVAVVLLAIGVVTGFARRRGRT